MTCVSGILARWRAHQIARCRRSLGDYPVAFGGESEVQLQSRMVAALSRIMARPQHDCVLAVSHGSACQEFLEYVTGGGELPDNGAVLHFGYCDGAFSLLGW